MCRQLISVSSIVTSLLLSAVAGCLLPNVAQAQTMECCAQLSCAQGYQEQACFSTTAPTGNWRTTPQPRASLVAPSFATDAAAPAAPLDATASSSIEAAEAPQHSPPELYTLHLALLI